ncbi:uncharacterized protein LOC129618890 [Condylostylus longicornis]|uniref:uncharacterized protein LOC129618890 n=1 Tax=Condylostylus longicornis TaxID=2530218 RepID=UPI00244DD4E1|nr:uncharacterized protein LOC129618890 [Condylostylus longicornis]
MENVNQNILEKELSTGSSPEDNKLISSQEKEESIGGSNMNQNELPQIELTEHTIQNTEESSHSSKKRKSRGPGCAFKKRYSKAIYILDKIARNEAEGKFNERDKGDKIRYQKVVEEYNNYKNSLYSELRKRIIYPDKQSTQQVHKRAKVDEPERTVSTITSTTYQIQKRHIDEESYDNLRFAVINKKGTSLKLSNEMWSRIEAELSKMVIDELLATGGKQLLGFDSSEVIRGYRVIKCENGPSAKFLRSCVANIDKKWDGCQIDLILAKDIPKEPRARIWIPKTDISGDKLLKVLKISNPEIPMDNWQVIKKEEPQKYSESFLLLINEDSLNFLDKQDNKLRFGIRYAKLKIFRIADPKEESVEETNQLLEQIQDFV